MVVVARSGYVPDPAAELHGWVVVGVVPATAEAVVARAAEFARRFGVQTARVVTRALAPALDVVGSVDFDPDHVAMVGARRHHGLQ